MHLEGELATMGSSFIKKMRSFFKHLTLWASQKRVAFAGIVVAARDLSGTTRDGPISWSQLSTPLKTNMAMDGHGMYQPWKNRDLIPWAMLVYQTLILCDSRIWYKNLFFSHHICLYQPSFEVGNLWVRLTKKPEVWVSNFGYQPP